MDWLDALPDTRVLRDPAQTAGFRHDESHVRGPEPLAVVKPRSREALRLLVQRAGDEGFTLVPRGAGSGKAGGCVPTPGSVVVDLSDWPGTIAVNAANLTLSAPASAGLAAVKEHAEAAGLWYPPDPNSWPLCSFGGSLATNAGGPNACKYGMTRRWVLSVEALMKGTVEVSDNPAANILLKAMGGLEPMQAFYRGIGDATTRVDRFEPEMNRLDGDKDTIRPLQSLANLQTLLIDADTPLSETSKALLLQWMFDSPTGVGRIKAGVPDGWRVAHKTGTGGYGPTNDIGVLYPPSGASVLVAAYYHAISDDPKNEAVIAEATRMALAELGRT